MNTNTKLKKNNIREIRENRQEKEANTDKKLLWISIFY